MREKMGKRRYEGQGLKRLCLLCLFQSKISMNFTPLEIMPRCSAAVLDFRIIPAGFNATLEFLTGFTRCMER
jgi:hypothetical protein